MQLRVPIVETGTSLMETDCHGLVFRMIIIQGRLAQRVDLRCRSSVNGQIGIYHCDITTVAVYDNEMRETVYMGLYTSDGGMYM